MRKHRGYYIDGVTFNSESEIDEFVKNQAINAYKTACRIFQSHGTMEASIYCDERAEYLVKNFGFTWAEVEALEIEAYKAA